MPGLTPGSGIDDCRAGIGGKVFLIQGGVLCIGVFLAWPV